MPVKSKNQGATQDEFKAFARQFRTIKEAKKEKRLDAVGTLTPNLLRKHLKSGQDLVLDYGRGGLKMKLTLDDLRKFAKEAEGAKGRFDSSSAGVPALKLIGMSRKIDIDRANNRVTDGSGIKNATLYSVKGDTVLFRVTASEKSTYQHHQVAIRLEEWNGAVTGIEAPLLAVRRVTKGRISFDCDCGRHQFWYRYLATIGNFALKPFEFAFPKIRNPRLDGCCCKHTIKSIAALQSPTLHSLLVKQFEKQADAVSFAGDPRRVSKYLTKEETARAERARKKQLDNEVALGEFEKFKRAEKAFAKKAQTPVAKQALKELQERNREKMKTLTLKKQAAETVARREIETRRKLEADMRTQMTGTLKTLKATGLPMETMIDNLAKNTNTDKDVLMKIAKEEGLL